MRRLSIIAVLMTLAIPVCASEAVVPPKAIDLPQPIYPELALRLNAHGTVVLSAVIDERGQVREVRVVKGLRDGGYGLEDAAMDAMRHARYQPATLDGKPVRVKLSYTMVFKRP